MLSLNLITSDLLLLYESCNIQCSDCFLTGTIIPASIKSFFISSLLFKMVLRKQYGNLLRWDKVFGLSSELSSRIPNKRIELFFHLESCLFPTHFWAIRWNVKWSTTQHIVGYISMLLSKIIAILGPGSVLVCHQSLDSVFRMSCHSSKIDQR